MKTPATIASQYKKLRVAGYSAHGALYAARAVVEFESRDDVRIRVEPEEENYFSVYGEPDGYVNQYGRRVSADEERDEIIRLIELNGLWRVVAEYRCQECGSWKVADSVGMSCGYHNPESPAENWYVPDLMRAALDSVKAH